MSFTQDFAYVKGIISDIDVSALTHKLIYAYKNNSCLIGQSIDSSNKYEGFFLPDDVRSTHTLVMGRSGAGKSRLIEFMIRQDILRGLGVCVIDPHGELYWNLIRFLIKYGDTSIYDRLYLFDPSNKNFLIHFNPFAFGSIDPNNYNVIIKNILSLVNKVSGESMELKHGSREALENILLPALLAKLPVLRIKELFFNPDFRSEFFHSFIAVSDNIPKSVFYYWENLFKARKKEDDILINSISGAHRRLELLLDSPLLQMMSMPANPVSVSQIVETNGIVLCNFALSPNISSNDQSLFGTLFLNEFVRFFFSRSDSFMNSGDKNYKESFSPFYLYIDEYHNFITPDIAQILSGGRKFGLHVTLANQSFAQIPEILLDQIKNIATTKIFFSVKDVHTAIEIYLQTSGSYSPRLKEIIKRFSSIPDDIQIVEDLSYSEDEKGVQRTTRSQKHMNRSKLIEVEEKVYFTTSEIELIEGKKIQNLSKGKFLCFTEGLPEAIILKSEWCFDIDCPRATILSFFHELYSRNSYFYSPYSKLLQDYRDATLRKSKDIIQPDNEDSDENSPFQS